MVPDTATEDDVKQLLALAEKFGDSVAASQYKVWLAAKKPKETPPKPLEKQSEEARQRVHSIERRLKKEIDDVARAKKWLCECEEAMAKLTDELSTADKEHKALVERLHHVVHPDPPQSVGKLCLRDILDGKEGALTIDYGEGILGLDAKEYELSADDHIQFEARKRELEQSVVAITKQLFEKVQQSVDQIKASHRQRMSKLHRRKPEETSVQPAEKVQPAALQAPTGELTRLMRHRTKMFDSLRRNCSPTGWKSRIVPAAPGIGLGTSGGVGIFVRDFLGCHDVSAKVGPTLVPHRAASAIVQIPGGVSILVVSAYLRDSEGLSESNMGILCKLRAELSSLLGPFILGADFQMEPDVLASCDLVSVLSANLVVPESKGTCVCTSKA
ncbi:unnamed protein product [Prorocentrum cordatum]|uniref:Uncharacterized protein n=1 Tax=Prorocentrum cordatum TaxID=2364126 RepID=A0ABN9UH53_9DINO|nr:unnamed protein product [Polarella glacialis]